MVGGLFSQKLPLDKEDLDSLRLIRTENVGPRTFFELVGLFGSPGKALEMIPSLAARGGRKKPVKIFPESEALKELDLLKKSGAWIITYKSSQFCRSLREIYDCPPVLTYKGNINLLDSPKKIAIVGARNASANGRYFASKISGDLIREGFVTVSGMARGIDTSVHEAGTQNSIAVLAGGVDYVYPPENAALYSKLSKEGLLLAELPIGSKPLSRHFPLRNRIISGLSLAVVVIEASLNSGSLITAAAALEQNREVCAVPGFPLDPRCQGTNKLIKEGARLTENYMDVISSIDNRDKYFKSEGSNDNLYITPSVPESEVTDSMRASVLNLLSSSPVEIDCLIRELGFGLNLLYTILLELELAGKIIRYPGNRVAIIYSE